MNMNKVRRAEIEYCAENPVYYIETYVRIEHKGASPLIQPFKLWEGQKSAVESLYASPRNIILKARQLGFTWLVLAISSLKLLDRPGRRCGAISQKEDEAMELVRRMEVIFGHMPEIICDEKNAPIGWSGPTYTKKAMSITLHFPGEPDSVFLAEASGPNPFRGQSMDEVLIDEMAFQDRAVEMFSAIFPTINDGGAACTIISTNKRGSLFEEKYTDPDFGFNKVFRGWRTNPNRTDDWYKKTLAALGPAETALEYPETEQEALEMVGGLMFPEIRAETHMGKADFWDDEVIRYVSIDYGLDMFSCLWIAVNTKGKARVYRELHEPNMPIGAACDLFKRVNEGEKIELILAPGDLWNREQLHGKSRADFFAENGMNLTRSSRDFEAGVSAMKEWFSIGEDGTANLTFENCPVTYKHLQKILADPKRPSVYAKQPHELTHSCDSLRYFCIYYISPANKKKPAAKQWTEDMLEDYNNANESEKKYLIKIWGEPT